MLVALLLILFVGLLLLVVDLVFLLDVDLGRAGA